MNTSKHYKKSNRQENGNFKEAKEKHPLRNVWTVDGKVLYKDGNDNKVKLCND